MPSWSTLRSWLSARAARWIPPHPRAWPRMVLDCLRRRLQARPRGIVHWVSVVCVWGVLLAYLNHWVSGNWAYLTDVSRQTDDVRTALFPFHRYGPEGALKDDPIAIEMLAYIPLLVKAVFRISVPLVGLFAASKVSQAVCLGIIVVGGLVVMGHRRAGLAGGALLVFLFLRDSYVIDRIASGLPRGYGFPAIALWTAGALIHRVWLRRTAIVLAALSYPSALAMTLGGEGVLALAGIFLHSRQAFRRTALRLLVTTLLACIAVAPALTGGRPEDGKVHTLEEAKKEPAFGKRGRLWILPFANARTVFGKHFTATYSHQGKSFDKELTAPLKGQRSAIATALVAVLFVISLMGLSPVPRFAIAFFASTSLIYLASRVLAFHLYSPERYYSYGMRAAGILLLLNVVVFMGYRFGRAHFAIRNFACASVMLGMWVFLGDGIKPNNNLTISARWNAGLHRFVSKLPLDVRIASHPLDGDDIPYFAARATMGGFETLQPWLKGSWARQKERAKDTLRAMYATDEKALLAYADKHGVTHFLVHKGRYRKDFKRKAYTFDPFNSFTKQLLRSVHLKDVILADVPKSAIVYQSSRFELVSVQKLRELWSKPKRTAPSSDEPEPAAPSAGKQEPTP